MRQTLEPHGVVTVDARFRESDNPDAWLGRRSFLAAVEAYFADDPMHGWEPRAAVVERFLDALDDGMAVCTGGRALAAVYADLVGVDAWVLWQSLSMPDVLAVGGASVASTS